MHILPSNFLPPSDPDECIDSTLNDCDENAVCKNEKLSFTCICKEGYLDKGSSLPGRVCVKDTQQELALAERIKRVELERVKKVEYEKDLAAEKKSLEGKFETHEDDIDELTALSVSAIVFACLLLVVVIAVVVWSRKNINKRVFNNYP